MLDYDRIIHPQWNEAKLNNDVAVIRLSQAIKTGPYAATVRLASKTPSHGTVSTVTGWGRTQYEPAIRPKTLQVYQTKTYNPWYWSPGFFTILWDSKTQVATRDENQGTCMGDSGGPLVIGDRVNNMVSAAML